jgi:hypothetical protein
MLTFLITQSSQIYLLKLVKQEKMHPCNNKFVHNSKPFLYVDFSDPAVEAGHTRRGPGSITSLCIILTLFFEQISQIQLLKHVIQEKRAGFNERFVATKACPLEEARRI